MIIGTVREVKEDESRVALTPAGVEVLVQAGHSVLVESKAGLMSGFTNKEYADSGASIKNSAASVWKNAEMIVKVKEPQKSEFKLVREGQIVFTYFHFAASRELTKAFIKSKSIAIAYETLKDDSGGLPLLKPMSEVAGRMSIQEGAKYLEKAQGGRGILLGGVPGVAPATVMVLGAGIVGMNATKMAAGLGSLVYVLDVDLDRLRYVSDIMPNNVITLMSNSSNIRKIISQADLVISSVLIPGGKAPKLVTRNMLKTMKTGAVIVDVAIDQGGTTETSKPTTHADPIYKVDGIVHYCVANMPGAMPMTSTLALTNATLPYISKIADLGYRRALLSNDGLKQGGNILKGHVCCQGIARAFNLKYEAVKKALE